ncbi:D-glycerate dehydrogenase [bacterium]|nr:MAG: D-glycerate dehydrogenase [bacterium]
MRIFVTQPVVEAPLRRLRALPGVEVAVNPDSSRILPRDRLLQEAARADVLCCLLHDRIDAEVVDAGTSLRLIANGAIHPANIDVARATARGIAVTTIPSIVTEATADLHWAILMAVARRIPEADRGIRAGTFPGSQSLHFAGRMVAGKTIGIVGFGDIGRAVARRAHGFGMRVLYNKRQALAPSEETELQVEYRALEALLRESDFVSLHASYHPGTHHLIGPAQLALMQPTSYVVNTARGPIVDEAALVEALRTRSIAGAALDVYEREPEVHAGLLGLDNVVLTPHVGSATLETREAIAAAIVDNVTAFLRGERPPHLVNPEAFGSASS